MSSCSCLTLPFQSTHPVRGGTIAFKDLPAFDAISIHPPREGWDSIPEIVERGFSRFQSTHPVRGGTVSSPERLLEHLISIHPPREGWDRFVPH